MQAYLGVDAGGSHTRAVIVAADGTVLGCGRAGPSNFRTGPFVQARSAVRDAVRGALQEARGDLEGREPQDFDVAAAFIGSAGLEGPGDEKVGRELLGGAVAPRRLGLDSDVLAAWAGAFAGEPGIVVSAGTGSICLGVTATGRRIRGGGWGPFYGDEGSAFAIARQGIKAALAAADGRVAETALLSEFIRFAELGPDAGPDPLETYGAALTDWLYAPGRSQAEIAGFAPVVENAALRGDSVAQRVLERAGHDLAVLVATVTRRWEGDGEPVPLATNGAVLRRDSPVRARLVAALARERVPVVVQAPRFPPDVGAALVAMELGGQERSPEVLQRLLGSPTATEHAVGAP